MKKTLQVLEVSAGITTFLLTLPNVYLTYISFSDWIQESRITTEEILIPAVIFLIVPALLVAIGSYFHSIKHKSVGFLILFVCGSFLTVTHTLFALVGSAFNGYPLLGAYFAPS